MNTLIHDLLSFVSYRSHQMGSFVASYWSYANPLPVFQASEDFQRFIKYKDIVKEFSEEAKNVLMVIAAAGESDKFTMILRSLNPQRQAERMIVCELFKIARFLLMKSTCSVAPHSLGFQH
jgi:hypothetical protein